VNGSAAADWLRWARKAQALAQTGLAYSRDPYHRERFAELGDLAAEMFARMTNAPLPRVADLFAREKGYATPKVETRAAIFRDGKILMVKERSDGRWTLPGGWVDVNHSPSEAVAKEVREEAGFLCRPVKLLAVLDGNKHGSDPDHPFHEYKLFFRCEILGGAPGPGVETSEVAFFAEGDMPDLSVPRASEAQVRLMFRHAADPARPADFD
jgi:ADP-ribose pyrophosphatase YjhB (NUDIX family)